MSYKNKKINKLFKIKDNDGFKIRFDSFFKNIRNRKKFFMLFFCFELSFILLLLCSRCSFLYPFNGWDDFNSFYTMASGWANGLIPYRDLFEQKGPFLYIIFMVGYFISPGKFIGIFILEVIFLGIILYISSKIVGMFINEKKYPKGKYLILLLYGTLITTSISFVEGGSSEEFNLLFTTITIFYIVKYLKNGDLVDISYKHLIICGICCGLSLMIKYTTVGLWFIMMAYICIKLFTLKRYKEAIFKGLIFIIMMLIPFGIFSIYFYINDALLDFLDVYFYINIFKYSYESNFISNLLRGFFNIFLVFFSNFVVVTMLYLMFCYFLGKKIKGNFKFSLNKKHILFIGIILFNLLILFYGQTYRMYAILASFYVMLFIIIYFYIFYEKHKLFKLACGIYVIIALVLNIDFKYITAKDSDIVQFRFADIINEVDDATILQYRAIDGGFYTAAGILPSKRHFSQVNISFDELSESYNEQDSAIINKEVDFVIVRVFDLDKRNTIFDINRIGRTIHNQKIDLNFIEAYYDLVDVYENEYGYYDTCIFYLYRAKKEDYN